MTTARHDPPLRRRASDRVRVGDVLRGGGEMGALMRRTDWSRSAVGSVHAWPQSLRTAVSILLDSHFPMYIAWGKEYVQFYNDGYRPILGSTKHPAAMGNVASATFAESWHIIGPMFDGVMAGTAVGAEDWMLPLDRHGYLEECYFTFLYSPIRDESGGVGGVHVTVTETTGRVLGERRLRTLRDLAGHAAGSQRDASVWAGAAAALRGNAFDLPFALLYRAAPAGEAPVLVGATGFEAPCGDGCTSLSAVAKRVAPATWPFERTHEGDGVVFVDDLRSRADDLPGGAWDEPPERALVLRIARPGADASYGYLVAGISARRALDDDYSGFLRLVADQIATAVANARAYKEEKRRAEALAQLDRSKTVFFSNISHEFRTPLTLLLGPVEDLLAAEPLSEQARHKLTTVHGNAKRLYRLVNSLLDFARIEAGRIRGSFRPVNLPAVTEDVASQFRAATERVGLTLDVDCSPMPPVFADPDMWEKVLLNLLSNALKFTFEGGIRVALRDDGEAVTLLVTDTGVGVPAEEVPRLYERFHRVEGVRSRTHEGSGIGLAMVHELVKLHGGTVRATSTPGAGTCFAVTLPRGPSHLPAARVNPSAPVSTAGATAAGYVSEALQWSVGDDAAVDVDARAPDTATGHILLADDNADMRDYIQRILAPHWRVEAVDNGAKALESARLRRPALVLTDVMMPELDGFELLRALRETDATKSVPVLMLSARAGEESRVEGLQAGADDYLVKPFSARELVARVRTHLELSVARAAALEASERLETVFMQAPVAISVVTGPEFTFSLANPHYRAMVGGRELKGKRIRDAFPEFPHDAPVLRMLEQVRASGAPFSADEFLVPLDRQGTGAVEEAYLQFTCHPILDAGGGVQDIITIAVDVTAQVEARRSIEHLLSQFQASEKRFRSLVEATTHTTWTCDARCHMVSEQPKWEAFTGQTRDEYPARGWTSAIHPGDRAAATDRLEEAVSLRRPYFHEHRIRRHDGEYRMCSVRIVPVLDDSGEVVEWVGAHSDITEVRQAEDARRVLAERLAIAQATAHIGVFDWHADGTRAYWSPELRELLDVAPESAPSVEAWADRMVDDDARSYRAQVQRAREQGSDTLEGEYLLRLPSAQQRWIRLSQRHEFGHDGQLRRIVGAAIDVDDLRAGLERERAARAEAERAAAFSEMFVGILGHDLRNPLSAIITGTTLLDMRATSEEIRAPLARIQRSADRMERMIAQLLDFTLIRLGNGIPLVRGEVDLSALTAELIEAQTRVIRVECVGDARGTWDRDRLSQLLSNLLANACEHGEPDRPIEARIDGTDAEHVRIELRNGGVIPPEVLPTIFDPLPPSGSVRRRLGAGSSGLGLGLHIARQIAVSHGGSIGVVSNADAGTRFVVELPRSPLGTAEHVFGSGAGAEAK